MLRARITLSHSLTVSVGVSKFDYTGLILVDSTVKLEKVALDGSVECCAPPPRWCDLEL